MNEFSLSGPLFAMFGLTFLVWVYMYVRRITFLNSLDIDPNEITPTRLAEISPPAVANPSDNLKNLFEMPVLFYALVLYLQAVNQVDGLYLTGAWTFVVFRGLHSLMHCTANIVMVRFALYAVSSVILWLMIGRAVLGS